MFSVSVREGEHVMKVHVIEDRSEGRALRNSCAGGEKVSQLVFELDSTSSVRQKVT